MSMRHGSCSPWRRLAYNLGAIARIKVGGSERVMHISARGLWAAGALVVMIASSSGCGKSQQGAPVVTHTKRGHASQGSGGTAFELADMVSAVSSGKAPTDVDLKFAVRERPAVGEPVDIDIALVPSHDLDQVYATFVATDGLEISKGGTMRHVEHPEPGAPITHSLTIIPQRDGIFFISATVLADSSANSVTHGFSIPVIAGTGIAASGAAAAPAKGSSH